MIKQISILLAVFFTAMVFIFVLNYLINSRIKGKNSEQDANLAIQLHKAGVLIAGGVIVSECWAAFQTLLNILETTHSNQFFLKSVMYLSEFLTISILVVVLIYWVSSIMYSILSNGRNVINEVVDANLGAAILFVGTLITIAIVVKTRMMPIFDVMIPYPAMPIYH